VQQLAGLRYLAQSLVDRREDVVLDPLGVFRLLVDLRFRRSAEGVLHLVDRPGHDDPEGEADHAGQCHVVDEEAEASRDAGPREPLDPRAQRCGQDEGEKDECKDEPSASRAPAPRRRSR